MVDAWSSMDSSNSPLTDSGPSASDDCTPSTSSEPPRGPLDASSPLSPGSRRLPNRLPLNPRDTKSVRPIIPRPSDKARSRDLTLQLETLEPDPLPRRPHFLDEDYQSPSKSSLECRIPKPHFLDHSPSPDENDEKSDITNPNFLDADDDVDCDDQAQKKAGALPKKPLKNHTSPYSPQDRHRTNYRTSLHYGLESAARSNERDKRTSQLYRGTWPGDRDVWTAHDSASVRSFSSNGSADGGKPSSNLDNKMDCVCSLISLLSLSPENNADLSGPLLEMSRSVESCIAMRQAGCIPLLVQLIHSKVPRETRDRAAKALRNIIHTQTDDKAGRREARVWRLLEQVREYCYILEDLVEARKDDKESIEDDTSKHPSQSVAALMKLSFDEEHRHVVCQLGGLQALAALVSGDQAAHGSRTDDNTCLTMRKYAGMTLTNLTFGDGNNKSLLCSFKDFMLALVEQLESPNDDMRQVTAAVLRNLSWRADTNSKQVLREVGAVKGLTRAAMTCQKEATLKSVLSALWNLTAHCSMNKVALCSVDGALGFLVDMLSYNSPTKTLAIVENAGGIMRNVSSHIAVREDYRQILRERNCLSVLLQHLKSPSLTVVSNSCGTLWNLSARCPQDQQFLWDHGAVPMLRSLIHSKHKMIAMGSSAALKNLLNSKPGKLHVLSLDSTARNMNLPTLPTLGARKQKALEQELDQNLAETCDNIEPATSPTTSNRDEKNLFTATERQIAMNLERHRMTSSSPLMGTLTSQISLSHSAHLASYLSCSNTLLKGALVSRSTGGSAGNVNRSDSKDSVTSTHSDSVFERVMRTGKVPIPTPRNKDLMKTDAGNEGFNTSKTDSKEGTYPRYSTQPPIPPPRSSTEMRTNYTESGYDVDQDSCDQPIDFSRKYAETKGNEAEPSAGKPKAAEVKKQSKKSSPTYGDYQETDLDQPTDYSLRYAELQSENGSDISEPPGPSIHEDTIKHFATEGTPYETPVIFSTATSMSDLRTIGKESKAKPMPNMKENPEVMTHSDEKDTCSIEDPPNHDNDKMVSQTVAPEPEKPGLFDTKFSSGMISPEKPVNYCDEGTPGYFSRVSSLSSLGEPTEEENLAKKNAMATVNMDPSFLDVSCSSSFKDKDGSKAVTFAHSVPPGEETPPLGSSDSAAPPDETPLMFSRSSSLGSLPACESRDNANEHASIVSEISRMPSGCISPSDIPDSPGHSAAVSPGPPTAPDVDTSPHQESAGSGVFAERVTRFIVENTPARLSAATSLSSLTVDDEPKLHLRLIRESPNEEERFDPSGSSQNSENRTQIPTSRANMTSNYPVKGTQTPGDTCQVYFTEDTPAILSKAGSNSNLSALSIESSPPAVDRRYNERSNQNYPQNPFIDPNESISDINDSFAERNYPPNAFRDQNESICGVNDSFRGQRYPIADNIYPLEADRVGVQGVVSGDEQKRQELNDTSDSSNLSDAGDLLEECIQKGIAKVVKNKGPPSDASSGNPFRDDIYRSLPPYLRSSTETIKMSQDCARNKYEAGGERVDTGAAPPLPPRAAVSGSTGGRKQDSRLPVKSQTFRDKPKPLATTNLARNDSLSSLSLDSFGSTDREIFEETVKAGLSSVNPNAKFSLEPSKQEFNRHSRQHKSLDRSDKINSQRPKIKDPEFEKNIASGAYNVKSPKGKKLEQEMSSLNMTRSPFSYHGESSGQALAYQFRTRGHSRYYEDGPPSLPARIDDPRKQLERSNSLSSMSNDSFGSTDKEVFERSVKMGMSKPQTKRTDTKSDAKIRVRSDDRLESRDVRDVHRGRRRQKEVRVNQGALDKMVGEDSKDRALLEEVIARGAREGGEATKNVARPSALVCAGGRGNIALPAGTTDAAGNPTLNTELEIEIITQTGHIDVEDTKESNGETVGSESNDAVVLEQLKYGAVMKGKPMGVSRPIRRTESKLEGSESNVSELLLRVDDEFDRNNETHTIDSANTTLDSIDVNEMDRSNECLAPKSLNTTIDSEVKDELNRSNESYADVLDGSWSDGSEHQHYEVATLTRKKTTDSVQQLEWTDIKVVEKSVPEDMSKRSTDTWNDNTCPDDVTFPTISGSVHMVASIKSEADPGLMLPDLLEKSEAGMSFSRPDLTNKLEQTDIIIHHFEMIKSKDSFDCEAIENIGEPSYASLSAADEDQKFDSLMSSAIQKEAARLAAQLKNSQFTMDSSFTSLTSLDLDNIKPPSHLGSLLSLSASGQWDEPTGPKKSQKPRKKSLPVSSMVKRALSNSMHHGSTEHLDSNPISYLDNVKPPSEMEHVDMEGSMVSVSSIVSEVADTREKTPIVFDLKQPIQDFPHCNTFNAIYQDLDMINPPSLFNEIAESTVEFEPTTAHQVFEDCLSNTLNAVTDILSGSENCTPLPSDISSVESTPKRQRNSHYLTPKEKRYIAKDRYQTYTITDTVTENDVVLSVETDEFVTWTKSESDKSDDYVTSCSDTKSKRKVSAKQRRLEDRARYQTQTVDIQNILNKESSHATPDPKIESLKQRLAAKKSLKQKRLEDAERFRTRTLSEDIPPSPTFVTKDANFENVETTTGYDSLSSNEPNHQQIIDDRHRDDDIFSRDADSGHNEDDFELNSTRMQTYTKSFRNYLPVVESPAAVDMCVVNNLKNIEMTASYRRSLQIQDKVQNPSSSDFASFEGDSNSEDKVHSDSEGEASSRPKPKIIKPGNTKRDASLDSTESNENEPVVAKAIRGRKKAMYVSPYRRNPPSPKKTTTSQQPVKATPKTTSAAKVPVNAKATSAKTPNKTASTSKATSANTSPKKYPINKSPSKTPSRPSQISIPLSSQPAKPLPLERQGTFTKEESSVPAKDLPVPETTASASRLTKTTSPTKPTAANTSPSRLPQYNRYGNRAPLRKANSNEKTPPKASNAKRGSEPMIKNSSSNYSLQSNDSGKTVTLARGSRQGSTSSVNSIQSKSKDVESKIASLWKKVEQSKKQPTKPDKRVWIESDKPEIPKLIRSSTFEGQPKQSQVSSAPKQKSAIGIRVSQIPSLRPKSMPSRPVAQTSATSAKKPANNRVFLRRSVNGQSAP